MFNRVVVTVILICQTNASLYFIHHINYFVMYSRGI
jgi:hypothetical protein